MEHRKYALGRNIVILVIGEYRALYERIACVQDIREGRQ